MPLQLEISIVIALALVKLLRLLFLPCADKLLVLLDIIIIIVYLRVVVVVRLIHGQGLIRLVL